MINIFGITIDPSTLSGALSSSLGIWYRLRAGIPMKWWEWVLSICILFLIGGIVFIATESAFTENQIGLRMFLSGCAAFTLTEVLTVSIDALKVAVPERIRNKIKGD